MKQKKLNLAYGYDKQAIEEKRSSYYSQRRVYHCCQCKTPQLEEGLVELNNELTCKACNVDFHQALNREDSRSKYFYSQGEGKGTLVTCKVCKVEEPRNRMQYLESMSYDLWFCGHEHMYAYKAYTDILYNTNYNLQTRIRHYTESTKSARHQLELNQTRIFRLAKILLEESDQTIQEALEPLTSDLTNHSWSNDEISLVLRAEQDYLYANEEQTLQQLLDDLFDTSHPDFTKETALKNLHNNFTVPVDLCKSCLFVQHQEDLDKHQGLCEECAQIEEKDNQDNTVVEL